MAENTTTVTRLPRTYETQDSITRPANTTQYAAGDVISDHATTPTAGAYFTFDFKTGGQGYGSVMVTDITLDKSDHDTTAATFWLGLFTTLPTLANLDDNVACAVTDAERQEAKGFVTFAATDWQNWVLGDSQTQSKNVGVVMAANSSILYGVLLAGDTYTPASGEIFTATAHAIQD